MRIAILNWSNRQVGGTGTYLHAIIPHLQRTGHDVALWHELDNPQEYSPLVMDREASVWNVDTLGLDRALVELQRWKPDLLYAHGLQNPAVEQRVLDLAPAVFFAHDYYGTCISGAKTFKNPTITPCGLTFGLPCLLHYFPRRCGGLSPVTMLREFRRQADRLELLQRYRAIVTHSTRMRDEYLRHGFAESRVIKLQYSPNIHVHASAGPAVSDRCSRPDGPWRLLFVGRMYELKGGRELLQALPAIAQRLARDIHVTFAGDGPQRAAWERLAATICAAHPRLQVQFTGWVSQTAVNALFSQSDLLVVPSLWPEPFGLVGLEAGGHGVPSAAFAVGGIPDWLQPGVNGFLAPGDPPTVDGLAQAVVACLEDERIHAALCQGARALATDTLFDTHVGALLDVFSEVTQAA